MSVSESEVERFQADGAVVLRGLFGDWIAPLREGVGRVMKNPSPLERSYRPADGTGAFFQDFCNWQRIPEFRAFVFESPAAAVAARLMRSSSARFFHDHVLVKQPGTSAVTPWHQDQPYYPVQGRQNVSFWVPLDSVARDTVMECVAGSHRWGKGYRPTRFDGTPLYPDDDFEDIPDIEAQRASLRILGWDVQPGDAIAFSFMTVHGAPANRARSTRRAFSSRWLGDDARYAERTGRTSPPFPDLGLRHGEALEAAQFPLVYRT
jgi:ectoine hydroxylase-related dioxygenase (phytanoyl-CoA dioxygenase family)